MNGLMLGTLLGLPLSTLVGEHFGWRMAFWVISGITVLAALATFAGIPRLGRAEGGGGVRQELVVFRNPRLWLVLSTSTLIIGATFSAFSYFHPILTEVTGFAAGTVPLLLVGYGAATVIGNTVVGRLADRYTVGVQLVGLSLNFLFLAGFAVFAHLPVPAVVLMTGIGLVGVTMNPAMVTRVQRTGNARPLVNTVHSSFITLGVIVGSSGADWPSTPSGCVARCGSVPRWPPSGSARWCPTSCAALRRHPNHSHPSRITRNPRFPRLPNRKRSVRRAPDGGSAAGRAISGEFGDCHGVDT
ncbi:MFS transporter [Streptomyces sp. Isolate_219]|nr:MFS transporter [Streptomyces sp. Isolate_219]MCR8577498.1 MFS transporter [Streptomyces sp. Isolate_219]